MYEFLIFASVIFYYHVEHMFTSLPLNNKCSELYLSLYFLPQCVLPPSALHKERRWEPGLWVWTYYLLTMCLEADYITALLLSFFIIEWKELKWKKGEKMKGKKGKRKRNEMKEGKIHKMSRRAIDAL